MLETIYAIGKEVSQGRDEWQDIIEPPKTDAKDEDRKLWVLKINLDLDDKVVLAGKENLEAYDSEFVKLKALRSLKVLGGNNKAFYTSVDSGKLDLLAKTLFGKPDGTGVYPDHGEFLETIKKDAPELVWEPLGQVLARIPELREQFFDIFGESDAAGGEKVKCSLKKINEAFQLPRNERIVLVYAGITCRELGLEAVHLGHISGFERFIEKKFFGSKSAPAATSSNPILKLCYATGEMLPDVKEAEFSGRYNINKYFQNTTLNYVSDFDKNKLGQNYQVSEEAIKNLDRGADYLLKQMTCEIADIRHVIIPQFFNQDTFNIKLLNPIGRNVELLFKFQKLATVENFLDNFADIDDIYWISFLGIDSDGNYFKAGNLIKDVPSFHFNAISNAFKEAERLFAPWLGGSKTSLNFYSIYKAIPIRKDKVKVNHALKLFAAVLEQRKVENAHIFRHFCELILCHWFGRTRSYTNITPTDKFDFAAKDAVFTYHAFLKVLENLDLLKEKQFIMETENMPKQNPAERVDLFFATMGYTLEQRALFYLGRVLSKVAYEQTGVRKHKKNALDKLNYNGMDKQAIFRFANELFEAGRHYDITEYIKWDWGRFSELFDYNDWKMGSQEALFFILTGYTFGIRPDKKQDETNQSANN
ncbi:MAG TPA: TM1802 family CRISPR-associated protein [Flavilitoribacter sp.]|nr:TM1802 family CRISPR-associated protein [Flavilitoribacter sp.]